MFKVCLIKSGSMYKNKNLLFILTLSAALVSCSWLSAPKTPNIDLPMQFSLQNNDFQSMESLPYLAWWQQFNDSKLNYLIESGLKSNLDVSIALSNLDSARGQLSKIQLSWIPFVNLYTGYTTNPAFGNAGTFYGIWPQYTINIMQVLKQQELAKYNLEMSHAMVDGVRLTVIGQISTAYFTLIAEQEQFNLLLVLSSDISKLVKIYNDKISVGLDQDINIADILVEQKMIDAQINIVQNNIQLSQNSLRYLINQNPGNIDTTNDFAKIDFSLFKPGNLPATVLQNRPDIKIAEYQVKASHTSVAIAYSSLFPSLQLDSFFGAGSSNGTLAAPSNYFPIQDDYINWGINPSTFGQIEAQKGAYQAQVYSYIQTVRKALRDTDNSMSSNKQYSMNYVNTLKAKVAFDKKYNLRNELYQTGIIGLQEILSDRIQLDKLAIRVNETKLQQAITLVNLYQELAGGYKYVAESH